MAYDSIIWEKKGMILRFNATVTNSDIYNANKETHIDKRFSAITYIIYDFLDVTKWDVGSNAIDMAAATDKGGSMYVAKLKCALVVKNNEIKNSVERYVRMSMLLSSTWEFEIFESMAAARAWIGLFPFRNIIKFNNLQSP